MLFLHPQVRQVWIHMDEYVELSRIVNPGELNLGDHQLERAWIHTNSKPPMSMISYKLKNPGEHLFTIVKNPLVHSNRDSKSMKNQTSTILRKHESKRTEVSARAWIHTDKRTWASMYWHEDLGEHEFMWAGESGWAGFPASHGNV